MPAEPRAALERLLERKRRTPELGLGDREAALDARGADLIDRLQPEKLNLRGEPARNVRTEIDQLYRRLIGA